MEGRPERRIGGQRRHHHSVHGDRLRDGHDLHRTCIAISVANLVRSRFQTPTVKPHARGSTRSRSASSPPLLPPHPRSVSTLHVSARSRASLPLARWSWLVTLPILETEFAMSRVRTTGIRPWLHPQRARIACGRRPEPCAGYWVRIALPAGGRRGSGCEPGHGAAVRRSQQSRHRSTAELARLQEAQLKGARRTSRELLPRRSEDRT